MLLVPLGADQFDNAERCVEAGLARRLLPDQLDVDSARAAVAAMLEDDDARERAGRAAAEIAEMPAPAEVANRLAGDLAPV
jgi:UDP:flavonoid glycosyltransferase YjiC (YdhE family)